MPYKYDSEKMFRIREEKDYRFVQNLLRSGQSRGSIRNKYLLSRKTIEIIDLDLISFDKEIVCPLTGKSFQQISPQHVKELGYKDVYNFCICNNCKIMTFDLYLRKSKGAMGKKISEESKQKIRDKVTGRKHSQETLNKLSKMSAGDKNPAKRFDVRMKIKQNHASNNLDLWEKTVKKIRDAQKGRKLTEEHKIALAEGKRRSFFCGSKAQRIAFEYIRKFLKFYKNINVYSNDHQPFIGCGRSYSVDMSIPQYKVAIEWDGHWHWDMINSMISKLVAKNQQRDIVKEKVLQDKGWVLIRIKDDNKNSQGNREYAIKKCREFIYKILKVIECQPAILDWEKDYKNKDYIKICLSDLTERKRCSICHKWILKKKNKTGTCKECYDKRKLVTS